MGSHYLTHLTQPAIPTREIWATLRPLCSDVPAWVDELVARIAAEREVTGVRDGNLLAVAPGQNNDRSATALNITAPSTEAAKKWQGWGTALKPAVEPIVLARKPLIGTVAENVLTHGTGALNIDASRIEGAIEGDPSRFVKTDGGGFVQGKFSNPPTVRASGRWPANILLDEAAAALLDEQSGERPTGAVNPYTRNADRRVYSGVWGNEVEFEQAASTGGASRFFYVAKASRAERNKGLERNIHPTVKPVDLMRYLIRLVTPKGGTVLDPFLGSGTTAVAAIEEGVAWIGCEREPEYLEIIRARVAAAQPGMGLALEEQI